MSWTTSIIITSSIIRLVQIPLYWLVKDIKVEKYTPKFVNKFIKKWYNRLILNDLSIDVKRNRINEVEKNRMLSYYDTNRVISWFAQVRMNIIL